MNVRGQAMKKLENHTWRQSLDSADFVLIVYTTMNLRHVSTFVDEAYRYYKEKEATAGAQHQ